MRRVVILGGGFAGAYCAQALQRRLRGLHTEVVLIDRNNYFVFYPFLVEAGTGSLEPRHAVVPIRRFLRATRFCMAEVIGVKTSNQEITYRVTHSDTATNLRYDHLIVALGSVTRLPDVGGLRKYGFEMKTLSDSVALRDHAIQMLEAAEATSDVDTCRSLLHFVVVGANFTGVEVAGEFHAFLRQASRLYPSVRPDDCSVTLIEITGRILPALDEGLAKYAARHLRNRGIEILLNTSVAEIKPDRVILSDGKSLLTNSVVWCAGIAPSPLVEGMSLPVDERGYILCDRELRVLGFENVWAIGDCAVNLDAEGRPYPATAQHAVRQGTHLAVNLAQVIRGQASLPCDIVSQGTLAALGCRTAVARVFGVKLAGFVAWFLWRTVYLLKMPGWPRKLRVALDWTIDLVFSRDVVQLGVHRSGPGYGR